MNKMTFSVNRFMRLLTITVIINVHIVLPKAKQKWSDHRVEILKTCCKVLEIKGFNTEVVSRASFAVHPEYFKTTPE